MKYFINRKKLSFISLLFALAFVGFLSLTSGPAKVDLFQAEGLSALILKLRAMRFLLALVAGAGLALCGVILQALTRNPLAEPYLLGISSGAAFGAVLCLLMGADVRFQPLFSFIGALFTLIIVFSIARVHHKIFTQSLILTGVIIGILISSLTMFLVSLSPNEALHGVSWWTLGSLHIFDIKLLFIVSIIVTLAIIISLYFTNQLNAVSLGEEEALHLGVDVEKTKRILFVLVSVITACIVSVCGIIGFVGLIIPHICRLLFGSGHRTLIPAAIISGAIFLALSDVASRTVIFAVEVPIGVITALIGAPLFIILFKTKIEKDL